MLRLILGKSKFTRLEEIQVQRFNRYCRQFKSKVKAVTMAPPSSEEAAPSTPPILISKRNRNKNGPANSKSINCRRSLDKDLKNHHESNSTAAIIIDGEEEEEEEEKGSKEWCVYLIISADMRKTYVGVTTNFKRRKLCRALPWVNQSLRGWKRSKSNSFNTYHCQIKSKANAVTMAPLSEEASPNMPAILISKRNCNKNGLSNAKSINCRCSLYHDLKNHLDSNSTAAIISDDGDDEEEEESNEWCVYLIISADMCKSYVGVTTNIKCRLRQHNGELNGGAKASRAGRPWQSVCLVHGFKHRSEACGFEWKWKHFCRKSSRKSKKNDNLSEQTGFFASPLVEHRQAALDRVKDSLDCQHLKIQWQGHLSSGLM